MTLQLGKLMRESNSNARKTTVVDGYVTLKNKISSMKNTVR